MAQLGSNLAPTWPPKTLLNRSQDDVEMQHPEKLIFATCKVLLAQGAPKTSKNAFQDHFLYECSFNLKQNASKLRFCSNVAPSWASQGTPRGLQGLLKTTLGSILGHLSCKFQFLASQGVPPGNIFIVFLESSNGFQNCFCSTCCVYSFC